MKTAYELAMERLDKASPGVKLNDRQKKDLAELDSQYAAKVAQREIALNGEIAQLKTAGEFEKAAELEQRLVNERKAIQAERDEKKEKIRERTGRK
jgi:hypothetical protein